MPMPILFRGIRWDESVALVESAGLRGIKDELDRAIAVWRFVAEHRQHGQPPTEGPVAHDFIKFLACYGYGFCDDSAQAVAALAGLCGLCDHFCRHPHRLERRSRSSEALGLAILA